MKNIVLLGILLSLSSQANAQTPNQTSGTINPSVLEKIAKTESDPAPKKQDHVDAGKMTDDNEYSKTPLKISPEFSENLKTSKEENRHSAIKP